MDLILDSFSSSSSERALRKLASWEMKISLTFVDLQQGAVHRYAAVCDRTAVIVDNAGVVLEEPVASAVPHGLQKPGNDLSCVSVRLEDWSRRFAGLLGRGPHDARNFLGLELARLRTQPPSPLLRQSRSPRVLQEGHRMMVEHPEAKILSECSTFQA